MMKVNRTHVHVDYEKIVDAGRLLLL